MNVVNVGISSRGIFLHKLYSPIRAVDRQHNDLEEPSLETSKTKMESLRYLGSLPGHAGWVTAIATSSENPDMILTASRGAQISPRGWGMRSLSDTRRDRQNNHRLAIDQG